MDLKLSGKTALVTGSSRGIGFEIAKTLHIEGCQVILNGRTEADLFVAAAQFSGAIGIPGDICIPMEAKRVVAEVEKKFGKLDILVCNVGSGLSVSPGNETLEEWHRMFSLNFWSTTNIIEAAKEELVLSKGSIVCISSICGSEFIDGAPVTYSAAKAALNSYVRTISRHLGKHGVRINAVSPGNILFANSVWADKLKKDGRAVHRMLEKDVALGCLGTASDVANLVAYLASPCSRFASGAIWTLDGGQTRA